MGGLFGGAKMPAVTPPTRMPVEGDQASREAKLREAERLRSQQGRASTELSGTDKLGK